MRQWIKPGDSHANDAQEGLNSYGADSPRAWLIMSIAFSRRRVVSSVLGVVILGTGIGSVAFAVGGGGAPKTAPTCRSFIIIRAGPGVPQGLVGHRVHVTGCSGSGSR